MSALAGTRAALTKRRSGGVSAAKSGGRSVAAGREGAVPGQELVEGQGVDQLAGHIDDAVLHDHVVEADQGRTVQRGRGPGLGGDPVPQGGLVGVARVGAGREAELLNGQRPAVGVGGLPDHAGRAAAQRGVQRPAAGDEPLGGVV